MDYESCFREAGRRPHPPRRDGRTRDISGTSYPRVEHEHELADVVDALGAVRRCLETRPAA